MIWSKRYRRTSEIISDILNIAKNGARKTRIMYQANLSFTQLKKYLEFLINKGLLEQKEDIFKTTDKGKTFIEYFKKYKKREEELTELCEEIEKILKEKSEEE